jgi:hypothetical protein
MQDLPIAADGHGRALAMDNAPSQSLLSLVNAILGGKPMEEVPMVSPKVPRLLTFFCPCDPVQDVQFYPKIGIATKMCFR